LIEGRYTRSSANYDNENNYIELFTVNDCRKLYFLLSCSTRCTVAKLSVFFLTLETHYINIALPVTKKQAKKY
jgi:hypothetical protein